MIDPIVLAAVCRVVRENSKMAAELAEENPVLPLGEFQAERDTQKLKVGDEKTPYNSLPYVGDRNGT